jgi:LacI family transcriptional regulator
MTRRFLMKEIALQAGVSLATVDRVLNRRPGVGARAIRRVEGALAELEAQSSHLVLSGRTLVLDAVVEAPQYFIQALDRAIAKELPTLHAPAFRIRVDARMHFPEAAMCTALARIARRGSDGVVLMGPAMPSIRAMIAELERAGIPIVTLASDVLPSSRRAYVGLNNPQAGATAAWFLRRWHDSERPRILVTIRNRRFASELEREAAFSAAVARIFARPELHLLVEGDGKHDIGAKVEAAISAFGAPTAIYSIGGDNHAIASVPARLGIGRPLLIGHDVNEENIRLLRAGQLDLVIHHDLAEDIRNACAVFASVHSRNVVGIPGIAPIRILVPPMLP